MNEDTKPLKSLLQEDILESISKKISLDAEIERMLNFLREIE